MTYLNYFLFFLLGVSIVKAFDFLFNVGCSILILKGAELTALNIKKIINAYPHSYRDRLAYQDWKGALRYLDYLAKNKKLDF